MRKKFSYIIGSLIPGMLLGASFNYETYVESWSPYCIDSVGLIPTPTGVAKPYDGVTVNIAFANYSGSEPFGIQFPAGELDNSITEIVGAVRANGGFTKLSFGGGNSAYSVSSSPNWPTNIPAIVQNVYDTFQFFSVVGPLDGIDFDIEDSLPAGVSAEEFATSLCSFLTQVRAALPNIIMTLTLPAQGWNGYQKPLAQQVAAAGIVDYINFMEYDIWIGAPSYQEQIVADIQTYIAQVGTAPAPNNSPGWGIPANLIQVGLMPGVDDTGQLLPLAGLASLVTSFIQVQPVAGIMTWDLTRDYEGVPVTGSGSYDYTILIRDTIAQTQPATYMLYRPSNQRCNMANLPFEQQAPPPHYGPVN